MENTLLNLVPASYLPEVHLSQYDIGRELKFTLKDGSSDYTVPSGAVVTVKATKPSGLGFVVNATAEGSVVTLSNTETMTNENGRFPAELSIVQGQTVIGTSNFIFNIERSPHPEGTIDGDAESLLPELTLLVNEIRESNAKVESMTASATSLPAGSNPTAEYDAENNNLAFGIPEGGVSQAEFDALKSDLGEAVVDTPTLTKINGKFINGSGIITDVGNNSYKVTNYIDVEGYDKAIVTGSASASNHIYAFYDESYNYISGLKGYDGVITEQDVDVPSGAKYLVIANESRSVSACALTKWIPYVREIQGGHREYIVGWKNANINSSGTEIYNQYPAITVNYLSTNDYDYMLRDSTYNEGQIYYYDYDSDTQTYVYKGNVQITPNIIHIIDKTYSHFRLRMFQTWSSAVNIETAKTSFKLYRYISVANPPIWFGKKWTVVGDSLTEINSTATAKYHDLISAKTGITVVNLGDGGTGYKSNDGGAGDSFMDRVANVPLDSDVITIFGSGNDLGADNEVGEPTDTGTTTLCGCINTTIDNLLARFPLANLGIITPTPWQQYNPSNNSNKMALYSEAIVQICKNRSIPCLDLYHCSSLRPWDSTFKSLAYANADGVHPNNSGHALIAPRIESFVDSLLLH